MLYYTCKKDMEHIQTREKPIKAERMKERANKMTIREKMVTRTVTVGVCNLMVVDTTAGTVSMVEKAIPERYCNDDKSILEYANKCQFETPFMAVAVYSCEMVSTLYGMPESVFIANAEILPPRNSEE